MSSRISYLGLLQIGNHHFALPASMLQEVVLRPSLTPLADPGPFAAGTFRFGRNVIPSLDIESLFGGPLNAPRARSYAAVVRYADVILGLEIDRVHRFVNPAESDISTLLLHSGADHGSTMLFPQQFWDAESGGAVGILNADALLRTPGVRSVRSNSHLIDSAAAGPEKLLHIALFKVQGRTFGVDVEYVRQALYGDKITVAENMGSVLYGHYLTADQQTPIIRLLEFLGLSPQGGELNPRRGLVIETPDSVRSSSPATVGFLVENVVGAISAPLSDLHSLAHSGMPLTDLYQGILSTRDHGYVIVLNGEALLRKIGRVNRVESNASNEHSEGLGSRISFIVYRAGGGTLASPLNEFEALVPLGQLLPLDQDGGAFRGLMRWRGQTINVLDLALLTGQSQAGSESASKVLIVREAGLYYGFLVTRVESMTSAVPRPAPLLSRPELSGELKSRSAELAGNMIEMQAGPKCRNVTVLDLRRLIQCVRTMALESGCAPGSQSSEKR